MNDDGVAAQVAAIRDACPGLQVVDARFLNRGQYADALLVNDDIIFRFPRDAAGVAGLAREWAVLRGVRGRLPLETPDPLYISTGDGQPGRGFLGYRLIPGEGLWHATVAAMHDDTAALDRLTAQLGGFLHALHTLSADVIDFPLEPADTRADIISTYSRVRTKLFPFMRPDARAWAVRHWETFVDTARHFAYTPALRHSDFGTGNLVYDPHSRTLRGVLDWQWAGPGDPATDLAGLLGYGERFVRRLAATYPGLDALWERVLFWHGTYALEEALYGIESGDAEAFEAGIRNYR